MAVRVALCGRNLADLRRFLEPFPVELTTDVPELVISYGGDGALLGAEREYPGVPKFPLRDSRSNDKCPEHGEKELLSRLFADRLHRTTMMKLESDAGERGRVVAVNDIVVAKRIISSAVRYRVWLDDELYANQIVGDGLVAATPFGSTGYYRSITHSLFRLGIGLAFNNSTEPTDHLVVASDTKVTVEIIRGPAVLLGDNAPARIRLRRGDRVSITVSPGKMTVLGLDTFRCLECARLRSNNRNPA
ncbi:MAG: hypothetical protein GXP31_04315 [Kiritimatiellaeota bacterium]|nr:hypothetical protein [Kiritimatiellota bacterium]